MSSYRASRLREPEDGDSAPPSSSSSLSYLSSSARRAMTSNGFTSTAPTLPSSTSRREADWTSSRATKWTRGGVAETVHEDGREADDRDDDESDNPESRRGEVIGATASVQPSPSTLRYSVNGGGDARRSTLTTPPSHPYPPPSPSLPPTSTFASHSSVPSSALSSTSSVLFSAPAPDKVPSLLRALVVDVLQSHRSRSHPTTAPLSSAHIDSLQSYCLRLLSSRLASRPSTSSSSSLSSAIDAVQREVQSSSPDDAVHAAELLQRFARREGVREKSSVLQLLLACKQQRRDSHTVGSSFSLTSSLPSFPVPRLSAPSSHLSFRAAEAVHPHSTTSRHRDEEDRESSVERASSALMRRPLGVTGGGREVAESISDEEVIRDVLFSFQGVDGRLLRFDPSSLRYRLTDDAARLISPPRQRLIDLICQLSALYRLVCAYVNSALEREQTAAAHDRASRKPSRITVGLPQSPSEAVKPVGLVEQSFVGALQAELSDYFRWVAVLESQWMQTPATLNLHRLLVSIHLPLSRLHLLASLCSSASTSHGGAFLSALYAHFHHGLSTHRALMIKLLRASCAPLFHFISQWIQHGQLHDPHSDFFIAADSSVPAARLWSDRYRLRRSMLPAFLSPQLGQQILVIGKSVNFIRLCCNDQGWEPAAADIDFSALFAPTALAASSSSSSSASTPPTSTSPSHLSSSLSTSSVERDIARCAALTNAHLLSLMSTRYNFLLHAKALKSYLLLSQGDFIQLLLSLLHSELHKPASTLNTRALLPLLDQAVRSSNARFEPADVLHRLSVRLLRSTEGGGDSGWDVFSLDYVVDAPLSVILTPPSMLVYLRLFNFLWRLKRVEWEVKEVWMRQSSHRFLIEKELRSLPAYAGLSRLLTSGYFLRQSMAHLLSNVSSYLQFEVMEVSWAGLEREVAAAAELGDLIAAHQRYVQGIAEKALVVGVAASLSSLLLPLFDDILHFTRMQHQLYDEAMKEVTTRQTYTPHVREQPPAPQSTDTSRRGSLVTGDSGPRARSISAAEVYAHTTQALLDSGVFVQEMPRWEGELERVTAAFHLHLHAFLAALDGCIEKGQMNARTDGAPHTAPPSSTPSPTPHPPPEDWPETSSSAADRSRASSTSATSSSSSSAYIAELEFLRLRLDFNEFYLTKRSQAKGTLRTLHTTTARGGEEEGRGRERRGAAPIDSTSKASTGLMTGGATGSAGSSKLTFSSTLPPPRSSEWTAATDATASTGLPPRPRSGTGGRLVEPADLRAQIGQVKGVMPAAVVE